MSSLDASFDVRLLKLYFAYATSFHSSISRPINARPYVPGDQT
jgi:hypothetical protein